MEGTAPGTFICPQCKNSTGVKIPKEHFEDLDADTIILNDYACLFCRHMWSEDEPIA